jgi:hypothetical protein
VSDVDILLDGLIRARQFMADTAQTDNALYQLIGRALLSMDVNEMRAAVALLHASQSIDWAAHRSKDRMSR